MIKKQSSMETTVVASDDGKHTFEILRKWDGSGADCEPLFYCFHWEACYKYDQTGYGECRIY